MLQWAENRGKLTSSLLRDGRNAASSLLCAQPLSPRSEVHGHPSWNQVRTLPQRHGGQRYPLHWCGRGAQRLVYRFCIGLVLVSSRVYRMFFDYWTQMNILRHPAAICLVHSPSEVYLTAVVWWHCYIYLHVISCIW